MLVNQLATFLSDPAIGGVTVPREITPAPGKRLSGWEAFGALNQVRRRILHSALAYYHDGQVLNLAGGLTGARTSILQSDAYYNELRTETWLGRYKLVTGEDNTCTRFMVQRGWKTGFLNGDEARVFAGVSPDSKYLKQVKRWSRDTARSYLKDVHFALKSGVRRAYVYAFLNIVANYASDAAVLFELGYLLVYTVHSVAYSKSEGCTSSLVLEHLAIASALTVLEHMPYFTRPAHSIHIPGAILYMYIHALIVLYSCLTLHKVCATLRHEAASKTTQSTWDSRPEIDHVLRRATSSNKTPRTQS